MFITDRAYIITRRGRRLKQFEKINASYTKIPNELLNDRTISWKAKGLFCHMASKTNDFNFNVRVLAKNYPDGKAAIYTALEELREKGWITYMRKAEGYSKYILNTTVTPKPENRDEANDPYSENRDEANDPYSENRDEAHKLSENRTNHLNPHTENRDTENRSYRKSGCINKNIVFNNKELYKGDAEKSGEKNSKPVQDASIALSTAMSVDQILLKYTGGDVNVTH